jgi:hypothetical protein
MIEAVHNILRLRRSERLASGRARDEIAVVREFLEELVGPTVRPADAARLLQISQPSLNRWIDRDEISTVMTPGGRREIPLAELVRMLEDVERVRDEGESRPVSRVIKERGRRSADTIDIDRLLPRRGGRSHRTAELQSLAYHRLVAEQLDANIIGDARRRLDRWRRDGREGTATDLSFCRCLDAAGAQTARSRGRGACGEMTRGEFEHVVKAAADIVKDEIVIVGSQSVLGQFPDAPSSLLTSHEVDVYPKSNPDQ